MLATFHRTLGFFLWVEFRESPEVPRASLSASRLVRDGSLLTVRGAPEIADSRD
jgi:hypothetical protein